MVQYKLGSCPEADLYSLAEQLVDDPVKMQVYDTTKWNLLGHADSNERFAGHHPWPKRHDVYGNERVFSVPVFSGYSAETGSLLAVRKDPWTDPSDTTSWLVVEQNLLNGRYVEPRILRVNIDAARRLWLQVAPRGYSNWPSGKHPALFAPPRDQLRIEGRMDKKWHLYELEYRDGCDGAVYYEDIEALESMIVAVQQMREIEYSDSFERTHRTAVQQAMGIRSIALAA